MLPVAAHAVPFFHVLYANHGIFTINLVGVIYPRIHTLLIGGFYRCRPFVLLIVLACVGLSRLDGYRVFSSRLVKVIKRNLTIRPILGDSSILSIEWCDSTADTTFIIVIFN
ncbi:TPA: hypothetical protein L6A33_01325 [Pseudomonas aeruginosa]|nr:hypothetical protein [Pseudomonas aeruginosa]